MEQKEVKVIKVIREAGFPKKTIEICFNNGFGQSQTIAATQSEARQLYSHLRDMFGAKIKNYEARACPVSVVDECRDSYNEGESFSDIIGRAYQSGQQDFFNTNNL